MTKKLPFKTAKERSIDKGNPIKKYRYNSSDKTKIAELECIIACSREIPWITFIKNVDKKFIKEFEDQVGIPLKEKHMASFYKSITPNGTVVYYFKHSSIEYIFY